MSGLNVTLTVIDGVDEGKSVPVRGGKAVIGRGDVDLRLNDPKISVEHAAVEIRGETVSVADLQSKNGILLNGDPVTEAQLKNLDVLTLGATRLRVMIVEDLETFRQRNTAPEIPAGPGAFADIGSLIDDELRRFSRWDLSAGVETPGGEGDLLPKDRLFGLEILEGPDAGRKIRLVKRGTTLGRLNTDILLHDGDVSRLHAMIEILPDGSVKIRDLGSTNGLFLGDERIVERRVEPGAVVRVGRTLLKIVRLSP